MGESTLPFVETNGIRLFVQEDSSAGEPLLLLHFGMSHLGVWEQVVPHFTDGYRVVRVDLRGHGRSDKPPDGYDLATLAQDIIGVMDALQIERAHLVGSSMGAEVATALAATAQGRVITLALEGLVQNAFGPHSVYGEVSPARKAELRAARALQGAVGPLPDGGWGPLSPPYAQDAYMETFWDARFDQLFEQVNCPVLFLPDEDSLQDPVGKASLAWFRSLLRYSAVAEIPGARHAAVLLDQPERFARAIRQFHRHVTLLT